MATPWWILGGVLALHGATYAVSAVYFVWTTRCFAVWPPESPIALLPTRAMAAALLVLERYRPSGGDP